MMACRRYAIDGRSGRRGRSVEEHFPDLFGREVEVSGEFEPGDRLVGVLLEVSSDSSEEFSAVPFTPAGNALYILGVNAEAGGFGFHRFCFCLLTKFAKQNG